MITFKMENREAIGLFIDNFQRQLREPTLTRFESPDDIRREKGLKAT